jgi:hypothetical protein
VTVAAATVAAVAAAAVAAVARLPGHGRSTTTSSWAAGPRAVVAARLSEDPRASVGVLERGPSDRDEPRALLIRRWAEMLEGEYDLDYRSVPQPRGNSHIRQARAAILGGCAPHTTP